MEYKLPTLPYEALPEPNVSDEELKEKENRIVDVLSRFGINYSKIDVTPGPVISFFEVYPERGVKVSKISKSIEEIRDAIGISGCRIICPIPGRGSIGIEIPNDNPQLISLNAVASSKEFAEANMELPLAIGVNIEGKPMVVDLTKMPHILIVGASGIGKIQHSIISSLLCKKSPEDIKLVLIDPKLVEFTVYEYITDYLAARQDIERSIVTDVNDAVSTLESLCEVMNHRYDLLRLAGARNIKDYNKMVKAGKLDNEQHKHLPYIVTIIDEFGDLIMTAGKDFEMPLCRLAQLSRAVGIHIIISTQRPASYIISGTIKANFPCRIAFHTMSLRDSFIILDHSGAECLIGRGDMLFTYGGTPIRIQGAYINEINEVPNICQQIIAQETNQKRYELPALPKPEKEKTKIGEYKFEYCDPLFEDAARFFVENQIASIAMLQRKFSIGFNRAGRLLDMLESAGIIEPIEGSFQRRVLIPDMDSLTAHLAKIKDKIRHKAEQ